MLVFGMLSSSNVMFTLKLSHSLLNPTTYPSTSSIFMFPLSIFPLTYQGYQDHNQLTSLAMPKVKTSHS